MGSLDFALIQVNSYNQSMKSYGNLDVPCNQKFNLV